MKYAIEKKVNGELIPQEEFATKEEAIDRFYEIISLGPWCYNPSYYAWISSPFNTCVSLREMKLIKL
jgi:hypothetical protein